MARSLRDNKINLIIYALIGGAIVLIILFISLIANSGKNQNQEPNLQARQIENSTNQSTEEANSQIGKNVTESKEEENSKIENENNTVEEKVANNEEENDEKINVEVKESQSVSNKNEVKSSNNQENNSKNIDNSAKDTSSTVTQGTTKEEEKTPDPTFNMPVEGEIVKKFGKDKLIYSDTLKEWTTHLGIDIKADKTSIVKAAADGTVKSIKNDPRYGLTVVIEHTNGFSTVYANLLTAEFVVAGENVKMGQTIGTVGNSATFEILDDPHLHFELLKDGNNIDPEMYIK